MPILIKTTIKHLTSNKKSDITIVSTRVTLSSPCLPRPLQGKSPRLIEYVNGLYIQTKITKGDNIMSQVNNVFVKEYELNLITLSQQLGSKLRNAVTLKSKRGENVSFRTIGSVDASDKTARYPATPITETPFAMRWCPLLQKDVADLVDSMDEVQAEVKVDSNIVQAHAYALGRAIDDWIIAGFDATVTTGKDLGGTDVFPVSQTIAVDYEVAATNTGLTLEKLNATRELFESNDVDEGNPMNKRYMAVSPKQMTNLLATTEIKSADYNTVKALVNGQVNSFLGFEFINITRLPVATSIRSCFAWAQSGMYLNLPVDIQASIDKRPDLSNAWQMYAICAGNALRMENKKVVKVLCSEV